MHRRLARFAVKLAAVSALTWGAAWLTGCCCCGTGVPDPGGEFAVMAEGRSTLPDLEELRAAPVPTAQKAMGY